MTNQDQIKALAELDGKYPTGYPHDYIEPDERLKHVPDYLHSYDAIIPLVQKQLKLDNKTSDNFFALIEQPTGCTGEDVLSQSPAQLCEALLRAHDKWID